MYININISFKKKYLKKYQKIYNICSSALDYITINKIKIFLYLIFFIKYF